MIPLSRQASFAAWALFLLALAYYFGLAGFPIAPIESDGLSMAAGATQIMEHGWDGPRVDYGRESRPGVFWALIALRWITGAESYVLFCLLSVLAGITFVISAAYFASRFVAIPVPWCGLCILLLFPDAVMTACAPDGSPVAACLGTLALCLLVRTPVASLGTLLLAGGLAGAAFLARLDSVLMGLASVPLLVPGNDGRGWRRLAVFAGAGATVGLVGLWLAGWPVGSVAGAISSVMSRPPQEGPQSLVMFLATNETARACLVFFPALTVLLIVAGTVRLFSARQWRILVVAVAGLAPVFLFYGSGIYNRPLYYTIPLFALLALAAVEGFPALGRRAKWCLGTAAAVLFVGQYLLGLNVVLRQKPYYPCARPTLIALAERQFAAGPLLRASLVVGAGGLTESVDGPRCFNGLLFYPLALHLERRELACSFRELIDCLQAREDRDPYLLVYTSTFTTRVEVARALQGLGYSCHERGILRTPNATGQRYVWKRDGHTVVNLMVEDLLDPWAYPELMAADSPPDHILYVASGGRERTSIERSGRVLETIVRREVLLPYSTCLYEVRW